MTPQVPHPSSWDTVANLGGRQRRDEISERESCCQESTFPQSKPGPKGFACDSHKELRNSKFHSYTGSEHRGNCPARSVRQSEP